MSMVFRSRRSSMILKRADDIFVDVAGPTNPGSNTGTLSRYSKEEAESTVDDDVDPLDDRYGVRDLATLSELSSDVIVQQLYARYGRDLIYTAVGDILIAVNPFREIPQLYGEEAANRYLTTTDYHPVPHIYSVAQRAYKHLLTSHKDQCCVISGESGAGKTETAKLLVDHMLAMCKGTGKLERQIVEVNPLLEAFGNARTVINDNSSRFGKFLEIKFGYFGDVLGAHLAEYLLEKSRVVRQADGEQNFHVFYYLFAGIDMEHRNRLGLTNMTDFHYLRGGVKNLTRDTTIDTDEGQMAGQYRTLIAVMETVGFTAQEIDDLHQVLASILHLGNIEFTEGDSSFAEVVQDAPIDLVANMLGIPSDACMEMMVSTVTAMRGERLRKNFNVAEADENRDALAKAIYGRMFSWIVRKANTLLRPRGAAYERAAEVQNGITQVGILDIFGFENFEHNSFEQFCINVANEQLQYYFNQHIFASEQSLYESERLNLASISYEDNGPLLDMILGRPLGLFTLLDEECRFPRASANTLVNKFKQAQERMQWEQFQLVDASTRRRPSVVMHRQTSKSTLRANRGGGGPYFRINHYAGSVVYDSSEFLEKNRDKISQLVIERMRASTFPVLRYFFSERVSSTGSISDITESTRGRATTYGRDPSKMSVSAHFKGSLDDLMVKMLRATPHFIRCIKPNDEKRPRRFESTRVAQQLKYTGVLETTRIRRDGYALRLEIPEFLQKFQTLGLHGDELHADWEQVEDLQEMRRAVKKIMSMCGLRGAQTGITRVFLKYYHDEKLTRLLELQNRHATCINAHVRGFLAKIKLAKLRRQEAERQEQLRREREAAEAARHEAEEQAKLALKMEREATLRRQKQQAAADEARQRAEEAAKRAAQLEAEQERERQEAEARASAEAAQREAELRAVQARAAASADAQRESEKLAKRERLRQQYLDAMRTGNKDTISRVGTLGGTVGPKVLELLEHAEEYAQEKDYENAFDAIFDDEDIDVEEREALRQAQQMRKQEEAARKRQLKAEYELRRVKEEEEQMRELQRIQEAEAERARREAEAVAAEAESAKSRMAQLTFNFAWDDAPAPPPTSAPAPVPDPVPPAQSASVSSPPPPLSPKPQRGSPAPPPVSPKPSPLAERRYTTSAAPQVAPKPVNRPPPVVEKPRSATVSATSDAATTAQEPRRRKLVRGGNKKEAAVLPEYQDAIDALSDLDTFLDPQTRTLRIKRRGPSSSDTDGPDLAALVLPPAGPPPTKPPPSGPPPTAPPPTGPPPTGPPPVSAKPSAPGEPRRRQLVRGGNKKETPVLPEYEAALSSLDALESHLNQFGQSIRIKATPAPSEVVHAGTPTDPPPPAPRSRATTEPATSMASSGDSSTGEPRRRKLVRGGNKKETPVLPEYLEAMSSLDALEQHLSDHGQSIRIKAPSQAVRAAGPSTAALASETSDTLVAEPTRGPPPPPPPRQRATTEPASAGEPRRRKLVRGGNKKETPVLPEFSEAMSALSALDDVLDSQSAREQALDRMAANITEAEVVQRRESHRASRRGSEQHVDPTAPNQSLRDLEATLRQQAPRLDVSQASTTADNRMSHRTEYSYLSTSHTSRTLSPEDSGSGVLDASLEPSSPDASLADSTRAQDLAPPPMLGRHMRRDSSALALPADFGANLTETQRIAIFNLVRAGEMTVSEALEHAAEQQQRKNCSIQ